MSGLQFDARINGAQLQRDIANINRQIGLISTNLKKEGKEIDDITMRIGRGLAGAFSVMAAGNFIKDMARVRGEFQQLEVAFETMLGSKEKADALMAQVVEFAARTPFELSEVASGAKQLLAFGIEAEKILPTLKAMGDVSAGLSVPIERLIVNFGQVRTATKLTGRELRDFQIAGVPVVAELAKNMKTSEQAIMEMVEKGKIGFGDVEQAFISMTSEGGRFSDLMEKQAKTITGLASNFADAWDRMLNSIGQENEGIIANSISGATRMLDNYEEILKVLKLLVATYGSYKAAVIATAVVQKSMAFAENVRLVMMFRKELGLATAAQQAFNTATKANPYILVGTAIMALISYLVIFRKETKTVEDHIADLNDSIASIGKQVEVNTLIEGYEELSNKTERTKDEQADLNKTVAALGDIFPDAVTEIDKYGRAVELSGEKIAQMNAELRDNAKALAEMDITAKQQEIDKLVQKQSRLMEGVSKNQLYVPQFDEFTVGNEKLLQQQRLELQKTTVDIERLQAGIGNLKEQVGNIEAIDANAILEPYRELFGEVETYSEARALEIKGKLEELLALGLGSQATAKIKEEIDKIAEQMALPTIQEQIQQVLADLKTAQNQLDSFRAPGSRVQPEQIKSKEEEVKALQEKHDALTGVNSKAAQKALEAQKQAEQKRLQAIIDFHKEQVSLERQLEAERIAIEEKGAARRIKEAELQHERELDSIAAQQQAYLEAWNATQGFEAGDAGFVSELPKEEMEQFAQLRLNSEKRKNDQIEQINRETAAEIKAIWQDVNDVFQSESERDVAAINQRYDGLVKRAKEAGETDFSSIESARMAAVEQSAIDSGMRRLQFEEEVQMQMAEISTQGFNREIDVERKKLNIVKEYAQKKIDLLKTSNTTESTQEVKMLELLIQSADNGLKELDRKTLTSAIDKTKRMVDEFKNLSDVLFGADSRMSKVIGEIGKMGDSFARIASGDYSGAISLLTQIMTIGLDTSNTEERLSRPWEEFEKWIAASNRELQNYIRLRDNAIGSDRYSASDTAIEEMEASIQEAQAKMQDLQLTFTFEGSGWFAKAGKEIDEQIKKLREQLGGGEFNLEDTTSWGVALWQKVKEIYSYDLDQLLFDSTGEFTIEKINQLIADMVITDEAVIAAVDNYQQLLDQLSAAETQKQELLTATMAGNIADGIIDGFRQGYDSAADFAESFEELMKNAILNAVKIQTLEEPLKQWYAQFANYSESGEGLTEQEILDLNRRYDEIIDNARRKFDELTGLAGLDFSADAVQKEGLTGAIKGITEETAGIIAGQFTAMREIGQKTFETGLEQLDSINVSVTHLAAIEQNTRYNRHLEKISVDIDEMNRKIQTDL